MSLVTDPKVAFEKDFRECAFVLNTISNTIDTIQRTGEPLREMTPLSGEALPIFKRIHWKGCVARECVRRYLEKDEKFLEPLVLSGIAIPEDRNLMNRYLGYLEGLKMRRKHSEDANHSLGIPPDFQDAKLSDFTPEQCPTLFEIFDPDTCSFAIDHDRNYMIYGANQRGKSHLMCAIAREHHFYYFDAGVLYDAACKKRHAVRDLITQRRRMAIDDISLRSPEPHYRTFLTSLLKLRIEANLPTLVSSLFSVNEWAKSTGDTNLASRLETKFLKLKVEGELRR